MHAVATHERHTGMAASMARRVLGKTYLMSHGPPARQRFRVAVEVVQRCHDDPVTAGVTRRHPARTPAEATVIVRQECGGGSAVMCRSHDGDPSACDVDGKRLVIG